MMQYLLIVSLLVTANETLNIFNSASCLYVSTTVSKPEIIAGLQYDLKLIILILN